MPQTIRDLVQALHAVREVASRIEAWHDNDDESNLNSFANSGVGGDRSDVLAVVIAPPQSIARDVLRFTAAGALDKNQSNTLREAGFIVLVGDEGFVKVQITPTDGAYEAHEDVEEDDEPDPYSAPEAMELILIED